VSIFRKLLKIVIFAALITNTGFFQEAMRVSAGSERNTRDPKIIASVKNFCDRKLEKAKMKEKYSINDYFQDLGDIMIMEDSLHIAQGFLAEGTTIAELQQQVFQKDSLKGDVQSARNLFKERISSIQQDVFLKENQMSFQELVQKIGRWMALFYCKNLLFVLALFLLWMWDNEKNKFTLKNPVGLCVTTIIHPIVLSIIFVQWIRFVERSFSAEVELRRTKDKFFTMLSHDEIFAIRNFVKSNKQIQEWREELIKNGNTVKKSYTVAYIATIACFLMCCVIAPASTQNKDCGREIVITQTQQIFSGGSGGIEYENIQTPPDALIDMFEVQFFNTLMIISFVEEKKRTPKVYKRIDHIPLYRLIYLFVNNILIKKEDRDESVICFYRFDMWPAIIRTGV